MYKMDYFTEQDKGKIISFMKEHSFALVTGMGTEYPVASQLPLEIIEEGEQLFLTGHLMRKTDHHLAFEKNEHVLVIFQSPHAFINAGWYQHPAQASTVNYMAVHATGKISFTDEQGTLDAIRQLTNKHIGTHNAASYDCMPADYIAAMLKAIVGFKIQITALRNVFKLSQNKDEIDKRAIIEQLEKKKEPGADFIAQQMKERL
jgi:transcriptional regulator